jgi:divalent metal cation (Fe/Co/Zn/Cd) transporter
MLPSSNRLLLFSAVVAAYQAVERLIHSQQVGLLWAVAVAALIGFAGNEAVAVFRIRVGRQIGSAALVADDYHARTDGWTSLAVLAGAVVHAVPLEEAGEAHHRITSHSHDGLPTHSH